MAFDPIVKEPAPAAPAAPDPIAAVNAQLADMRAQINAAYQMNKGMQPQVQYVPYAVQAAQPEPQMTEEDMLADLPGAVNAVAHQIAAEREQVLRQEVGAHLGQLYEKTFARDQKDLAANPYYKFVADDLESHFVAYPDERFIPGRLKEKFDQLIGSKIDSIRAAEVDAVERVRAVDVAVPVSTSPVPARAPQKDIKLDPVRDEMRQAFNRDFGLNMSAREWVAIESKRELAPTRDDRDDDELPPLPSLE